jgi:nucleotide-binding universal stress UspA family protein
VTVADARPTTLVVGFDGSEEDRRVAELAADVALVLGASVELVRATDLASADAPDEGPSRVAHAAMAARVAERAHVAEGELAQLRSHLAARVEGKLDVRARLVEGRPHDALRAAADAPGCWIVVGARRARTLLARTVDQILRRATRPVLVVPDGCAWKPTGAVLTGIDAGELDAVVLKIAETVAACAARRMGVVHIRTNGDESTMLRVTEHLRAVAPSVSTTATLSVMRVEGTIAATLAEHARRVNACLLVVGTHGRRGVERWMLGSTAEALAHTSMTPFLVVR